MMFDDQEKAERLARIEEFIVGKCPICSEPGHDEKQCSFNNWSWTHYKTEELKKSGEISTKFLESIGHMFDPIPLDEIDLEPQEIHQPPPPPIRRDKSKPPKKEADMEKKVEKVKDSKGTMFEVVDKSLDRPDILKVKTESWKKILWSSLCRRCGVRYPISKDIREWSPYKTTHCRDCRDIYKKEHVKHMEEFSGVLVKDHTKKEAFQFKVPEGYKDPETLEERVQFVVESTSLKGVYNLPEPFKSDPNIKREKSGWFSKCIVCDRLYSLSNNTKVWNKVNTRLCSKHRDQENTALAMLDGESKRSVVDQRERFLKLFSSAAADVQRRTSDSVIDLLVRLSEPKSEGPSLAQGLKSFDLDIKKWSEETVKRIRDLFRDS